MYAVVLGQTEDVRLALLAKCDLKHKDANGTTALGLALCSSQIDKAELLLRAGSDLGKCSRADSPLDVVAWTEDVATIRWVLDNADAKTLARGYSGPISTIVGMHNLELLPLLAAKLRGHKKWGGWLESAVECCGHPEEVQALLDYGLEPSSLSSSARAVFQCRRGTPVDLSHVTSGQYREGRSPHMGSTNPEQRTLPYWETMVNLRCHAYSARKQFQDDSSAGCNIKPDPVWCADRFGQTLTALPDGRWVETGGEHEDHYDPDFCIYNDVFVHSPDGSLAIYCYPRDVFPPTDFHTATLVGDEIILIGNLAYPDHRGKDHDVVYVLSTHDFSIRRQPTKGDGPGRICRHRAKLRDDGQIEVSGGKLSEPYTDNKHTFVLDVSSYTWRRQS